MRLRKTRIKGTSAQPAATLAWTDLSVTYGDIVALHQLSLTVEAGTVLAVIGPNGAGKTSLANALSAVGPASATSVTLDGVEIKFSPTHLRARLGIGHLPDSRAVFPSLTVSENLRMGFNQSPGGLRDNVEKAYELFPHLDRRRGIPAGRLSGGEQQLLALARLMVAPPRVLIVDELSHGLAPGIVAELFRSLAQLKGRCTTIVIEQLVERAVALADNVLVLAHGDAIHAGPADSFSADQAADLYSLTPTELDPPKL